MLCSSESFTFALKQFVWFSCNLENYSDDDCDSSWNMSVMNNVINTFHMCSFVGLIV